jgi:hypothetical protein
MSMGRMERAWHAGKFLQIVVVLVAAVAASGCGRSYEVAPVEGVVLIDDKPASGVQVQFVPDVTRSTVGPVASAETKRDGSFSLAVHEMPGADTPGGVVVGWNRIVLTDLKQPVLKDEARVRPEYTTSRATPLLQEIKPGDQTIEIRLSTKTEGSVSASPLAPTGPESLGLSPVGLRTE